MFATVFDIIADRPLVWGLFLAYMIGTGFLAWLGHRRTDGIASFSIGKGDMNPVVVGVTLAASIASTATFVINPGFVYVHGLSALLHLGLAAGLGVIGALVILSPGFRRIGARNGALTLPHWVGERYGSRAMSVFFSLATLLSFTFVVLIVGGLALVMQATLGLSTTASAALVIVFVFSYTFAGGAYAHAYTNTLQGVIMVVVALVIVGSGLHLLTDGTVLARLDALDPNLAQSVNPASPLFGSFFSVWIAGFVIGFAVVCQPHILTKALYVRTDRDVRRYLAVTIGVSLVFSALLLVGLYALLTDSLPPSAFVDPTTGAFRQDMVMAGYVTHAFPPWLTAVITVALLAAGMSTLDGLLVALSSTFAHDLVLSLLPEAPHRTAEQRSRLGHRVGQLVLVAMGVGAFVVVLDPPKLLGIFGQIGVYGLVAASCAPVLCGVLFERAPRGPIFVAAVAGLLTHLATYGLGMWAVRSGVDLSAWAAYVPLPSWLMDQGALLGLANPAVCATYGILVSLLIALPACALAHVRGRQEGVLRRSIPAG